MAGVGTVPLVAATMPALPAVLGIEGDRDSLACECAAKNYRSLVDEMGGKRGRAGLLRWDARRLPLRDACLDVANVDVPFGKRHKVAGGNLRHLYGQAFRECARSMRAGGRLLELAAGAKAVEDRAAGPLQPGLLAALGGRRAGRFRGQKRVGGRERRREGLGVPACEHWGAASLSVLRGAHGGALARGAPTGVAAAEGAATTAEKKAAKEAADGEV